MPRLLLTSAALAVFLVALAAPVNADPVPRPAQPDPAAVTFTFPTSPFTPPPAVSAQSLAAGRAALAVLRGQVAAAEEEARTASELAAAAQAHAVAMSAQAVRLADARTVAQADLDDLASSMYRTGGVTELTTVNAVLSQGTVTQMLATTFMLDHVADLDALAIDTLIVQVGEASRAASAADEAARQAAVAEAGAAARLSELNTSIDRASAELDMLVGAVALEAGAQGLIGPQGCPLDAPEGTLREGAANVGAYQLCADSVAQAATPAAALAIKWAFTQLGSPYACKGVGRMNAGRFDCSSLVSRAYYQGAGVPVAGADWAPSTRNMVPWDGVALSSWYSYVEPGDSRPGDLVLFRTCTQEPCLYQHVVMLLADGFMLHTNSCGDVAHVTAFRGYADPGYLVTRRVLRDGVAGPEILLTAPERDDPEGVPFLVAEEFTNDIPGGEAPADDPSTLSPDPFVSPGAAPLTPAPTDVVPEQGTPPAPETPVAPAG